MKTSRFPRAVLVIALAQHLLPAPGGAAAPQPSAPQTNVLFDFEPGFDIARVPVRDAQVSLVSAGTGQTLRIATGHRDSWPGITLPAPAGHWDLSRYDHVQLDVRNVGTNAVTVSCRVDNPGADGIEHCVTDAVALNPDQVKTLRVRLSRYQDATLGNRLFGMRGYPVAPGGQGTLDPTQVNQLLVFVPKPAADHAFELSRVAAAGVYTAPTAWVSDADPYFPLIDSFGQYRHKDWPGKVHSLDELRARLDAEARELQAQPGPKDWDVYGGWAAGPQLSATGFFRTEKYQGRWWLVDPEGHLFFSHGIDCVRMLDTTPVDERESWFEGFGAITREFPECLSNGFSLKGHYAGRSPRCFSFAAANFARKYGQNWRSQMGDVIHRRLRSWGLNTIGMWSDTAVFALRRTPYVDSIGSRGARLIEGSEGYWGKFPDVFDPSFRESLRHAMAAKQGHSAGDRWCLGYFADNELSWGDDVSLALAALASPPDQAAKRVFAADLETRYGTIDRLNAAWGTSHASWDAWRESRGAPDRQKAADDLAAFYTKTADEYFRTVRDTIKELAPHQLYLGCRFAWVNARAAAAAARFCDVVSYNLYRRSVADYQFNGGADVPLIIGEFHFGALDRGMFHTGLVPVAHQAERARAYREYVEGALRHPAFVGCHWFQYQDEPTTGRVYDEENYQIGFVDIADTPYAETVAASREIAGRLYRTRLGE